MGVPLDPPSRSEPPLKVEVIPSWSPRIIVRTLVVTVTFAISLYLVYLLRKPISWVLIASFLAVALSGPVNLLNKRMKRGFAITLVYLGLLAIPIGIGVLIVPPLVNQGNNLIRDLPSYAVDAREFADKNSTLRSLEEDYNITEKLQEQAETLPGRIGDAANVLTNIGLGVVNSLFAAFTILVLAAFLLGSGRTLDHPCDRDATTGGGRALARRTRAHEQRGRRVRRRHPRPGHARRDPGLHRALDPRACRSRRRSRS